MTLTLEQKDILLRRYSWVPTHRNDSPIWYYNEFTEKEKEFHGYDLITVVDQLREDAFVMGCEHANKEIRNRIKEITESIGLL